MAAVDSNVTPATRQDFEVVETLAITAAATTTVNRALGVPSWAKSCTILLDITMGSTTPVFDFTVSGGTTAGGRYGADLDSTTDKFIFTGVAAAITQLTTDGSTPIVTLDIGPGIPLDTTGSATANSCYSFPCTGLPKWLIYTYIYDGTSTTETYAGTISVIWHK